MATKKNFTQTSPALAYIDISEDHDEVLDDKNSLAEKKDFFDAPVSNSSIILKMINESYTYEEAFVEEKLSPAEFFVYLYYEVLLELKLKENGGE